MDELQAVLLLALAMLAGCYVAGSIPLIIDLSEEKLRWVSVLGAGLLCGTALAVIVPEGIHALYEDSLKRIHDEHGKPRGVPLSEGAVMSAAEAEKPVIAVGHDHSYSEDFEELHALIGLPLVLGFVFMLLVDRFGHGHSHGTEDAEGGKSGNSKVTTTLGLVVHAAADGVAMGAAASSSKTAVQLIIFFAIMLHKAPAAFGLVSYLMHGGLERNRIRKHLLIFSLAAPILTLATFLLLKLGSKEALMRVSAPGLALLFSAGTFLYVATVHVLPEVWDTGRGHGHRTEVASPLGAAPPPPGRVDLILIVSGCLLPLLLSLGHHH
uniref:Zinc transporter ZIP9 n=1 Tax=Eptatretus burgeri TaxID=7764 RepID=A0A8C4QTR0_EPTBU